ncbi:hypothetical protein Tco_1051967 [Tanacetum coccineum]
MDHISTRADGLVVRFMGRLDHFSMFIFETEAGELAENVLKKINSQYTDSMDMSEVQVARASKLLRNGRDSCQDKQGAVSIPRVAITPDLPITDSLIMEEEHLNTISETESDEENESSVKDLNLTPSESEDLSDNQSECDMPVYDDSSSKNEGLENIEEQAAKVSSQYWKPPIYYDDDDDDEESSIPLRNIISELPLSVAITPDLPIMDSLIMEEEHLNTISETESDEENESSVKDLNLTPSESEDLSDNENTIPDSVQSLLNRDNSIIFLIEEFIGKLAPIDLIPSRIVEANLEEDICLIEKLLNDDSFPHSPEELNSEIPDAIIESFSPSPIPVEDSDLVR